MKRLTFLLPLLLIFVAACDSDGLTVQFSGTDVSLGSAGANIAVQPGEATIKTGTITGDDIPGDATLDEVTLDADAINFNASGKRAQTGTIQVSVLVGGFLPVYTGTLTVTDNVVTSVEPSNISIGSYNANVLTAIAASLPESERPDLSSLDGLTATQLADLINEELKGNTSLSVLVRSATGDLAGSLSISEIEVGGSI